MLDMICSILCLVLGKPISGIINYRATTYLAVKIII